MNGIVDYRRYFFNYDQAPIVLVSSTAEHHYTPENAFSSILAHDQNWQKSSAEAGSGDAINQVTFSNFFKVKDNKKKRFFIFNPAITQQAENIIHNYISVTHPLISVQNHAIIQDTKTQAKLTILPPGHPDIQTSIKTFSQ